jgi:hypothetical protein
MSGRRKHKTSQRRGRCDGKRRHADRATAQREADRFIAEGGSAVGIRVYKCGRHWHVGHLRRLDLRIRTGQR